MRVVCDFSVMHLADDVGPRGWGGPRPLLWRVGPPVFLMDLFVGIVRPHRKHRRGLWLVVGLKGKTVSHVRTA